MATPFDHKALSLQREKLFVYTAMSKKLFYFRTQISAFVLKRGAVPLNPFMLFDYFLTDSVDRDTIREANNNVVRISKEIWVFGNIADGVLAEIRQAKAQGKSVKYFQIVESRDIVEISKNMAEMEEGLENYRMEL